jgi:tellurite resistance protein TerC
MVVRLVRKVIITVIGLTTVAVGVAMIVLPGPAFIAIPAGLAILATEFVWAKRLLAYSKERASKAAEKWRRAPGSPSDRGADD